MHVVDHLVLIPSIKGHGVASHREGLPQRVRDGECSVRGQQSVTHNNYSLPVPLPTHKRCALTMPPFRICHPSTSTVMDPNNSIFVTGTPIDPLIIFLSFLRCLIELG
jgi:hypothetical protein